MSACYCTKSCQYHIKYPTHVYSDVIQKASYLDLELYSHSWRISTLQAWLHHSFCCFDVFRMITMKTWLNAPGVCWNTVRSNVHGGRRQGLARDLMSYWFSCDSIKTDHGNTMIPATFKSIGPSRKNCIKRTLSGPLADLNISWCECEPPWSRRLPHRQSRRRTWNLRSA